MSFACATQRLLRLDLIELSVEEILIKTTIFLNSILVLLFSVRHLYGAFF